MPAQSFRQNGGNHDSDTSDERETDCRVDEARDAAGEAMSDEQLAEILAKRRIRYDDITTGSWLDGDTRYVDKPLSDVTASGIILAHAC